MATRFLKVDLSPAACDFEQVALEQGIPLLDRTGAAQRTLRKWLGRLAAEPEWNGTEVSFYVCDDRGARPHDVRCEPATAQDLSRVKSLGEDFETLRRRLKETLPDPKDPKEAMLLKGIVREFKAVVNPAGTKHFDSYFFKYLDRGTWRLVWCWGYQRKDLEPAAATICTNPACRFLFVRRQEGSRDCPACASQQVHGGRSAKTVETGVSSRKFRLVSLVLLIALLAGGFGYMARTWLKDPAVAPVPPGSSLVASPATWQGPAGSRLEYRVVRNTPDGQEEDVTAEIVAVSDNPKIVRIEPGGTRVHARSQGSTAVHFYLGGQQTHATIEVQAARNPESIQLDPAEVTLGVGSTAPLRVHADLGDGKRVDITEMAEWEPVTGSSVSCHAGQLEGLVPGQATVVARYRATPDDPYRTAEAAIRVVDENYTKLEIGVTPSRVREGGVAALTVSLVNDSGQKRSALNSSLLALEVDAPGVAAVQGEHLRGLQTGKGILKGTFGDLSATSEFTVESDLTGRFLVSPKDLRLMVGELAELQVSSASSEPIRVVSSAPEIVAVAAGTKVVGRAPGRAELTVTQEARETTVEVQVEAADLESITFAPSRISVPVDRLVPVRLMAQTKDDQQFELAGEAVVWEEIPQNSIVELDVKKLELLGRHPTGDTPQAMVARVGDLRARGQIDVVPGPLQIELTPAGAVDVPLGQTTQLQAWARYGDGTRAEVDPRRIQWRVDPASPTDLRFDPATATIRAVTAGGTMTVGASYQGSASNRVEFRAIAQDYSITLQADRELILVGDRGRFRATIPESPIRFALWNARFESSAPELLEVDSNTGNYRALAPGTVQVTVSHPNAKVPDVREFQIASRDAAELVIRPDKIKLLVNARQPLELILVSGGREENVSLVGQPAPHVAIGKPQAVRWQSPVLFGVRPQEPFEITIQHSGKTARAVIEVVSGDGPIRVRPERARLSPGQALSPSVEQQIPDTDQWQEIAPALVSWQVPDALRWTPARGELRPQLTPADAAEGTLSLEATYAGQQAELRIEVAGDPPAIGPLAVVREPEGEELPVDEQQRYTIVVQQGDSQIPATRVTWQPAFENDYVRWNPPLLVAKRPGHEQSLFASVGGEAFSFVTRTVPATKPPGLPDPPTGPPAEVRIVAEQPQPIGLPLRSRFSTFRVEAVYPGRPPADVTRVALLRVVTDSSDLPAPITVTGGQVVGQRPGQAELQAEFNGVVSTAGLRFDVSDQAELTAISLSPSPLRLQIGESVTVDVTGYTGSGAQRHPIGDVAWLPDLNWRSDQPAVVKGDGPTLTGLSLGKAKVTVTAGAASASIDVEVVDPSELSSEQIVVSPEVLRLKVGESKWLGRDVIVRRGKANLSDQITAASSATDIVRYHRNDGSLEGVAPGRAALALTVGGKTISLPVVVEQGDELNQGTVVIEPAAAMLVVGEYLQLRVLLVNDAGQKIDRTGSAILETSAPEVLSVVGGRITGLSVGDASIRARLPGVSEPGLASFQVAADEFKSLQVVPSPLSLVVGERKVLRIEAVGSAGRRPLGDHPDLQIIVGGAESGIVELSGSEIRGVSPGKATLDVRWKNLGANQVAVEVTDPPLSGLRIDPPTAQVTVNHRERFRVYAQRGSVEQLITPGDGLRMAVDDTSIATVGRDLSISGLVPGTTTVTAQLGLQRASAQLTVVPDSGRDPAGDMPPGLRFIPDVLTLQLGVPGAPVRLVNVSPEGSVEDLDHQAQFDIQPEDGKQVLSVTWTARGPVFVANKVGEAEVRASSRNLTTSRPLLVRVVDPDQPPPNPGPARLEVQPDPLRLAAGETAEFRRVQLVPPGAAPIDVEYQLESKNEQVVVVEGTTQLRGVAVGQAQVTVRSIGIRSPLGEVTADVAVIVTPAKPPTPHGSRLVLTGPSRAIVGGPASFRVELSGEGEHQDITHQGAALVLDGDQASAATLQPGCIVVPHQPTTLSLRARFKDLVSNTLTLNVAPPGQKADFAKLEIEVDGQPLAVGERRPYSLWGHPVGGGARQDLTPQVRAEKQADGEDGPLVRVVPKGTDAAIVAHAPPTLVAKAPGMFAMRAEYGDLKSEVINLEISETSPSPLRLVTEPSAITIRVGQPAPSIQVLATAPGGEVHPVDATWSSADSAIIGHDPQTPGQFIGRSAGQTQLKAAFHDQEATVAVTVTGDAFEKVEVHSRPDFLPANRFTISASVSGSAPAGETLEYRVVTAGGSEEGSWKAPPGGPQQSFELSSPPLKRGPDDTKYHLMIEARDEQQRVVARYPLAFRLDSRIQPQPQTRANE